MSTRPVAPVHELMLRSRELGYMLGWFEGFLV